MTTTGIHPSDLRRLITDVLQAIDLYSEAAVAMLLGTAAQESKCGKYIYQLAGGPARGIFQMEPSTEEDIWANFLVYRNHLRRAIGALTGHNGPGPWLTCDLAYQICMTRIHYLRVPEPLPDPGDIVAQASYWKTHYNTKKGRGHVADYIRHTRTILSA